MDIFSTNYDAVVIGNGISGASATHFLSLNKLNVLSISLELENGIQPDNSSQKFQGWLHSGETEYLDKYPFLSIRFSKAFESIIDSIHQPEIPQYGNKAYSILCMPPSINDQLNRIKQREGIKTRRRNEDPSIVKDLDYVKYLAGNRHIDQSNIYRKILDIPYDVTNLIFYYNNRSAEINSAKTKFVKFLRKEIEIKANSNSKEYDLFINGIKINHKKLFVCAGSKSISLLSNLFTNTSHIIDTFKETKLAELKIASQYFLPIVRRTPIFSIPNLINFKAQLWVDYDADIAIIKNPVSQNLIITSAKPHTKILGKNLLVDFNKLESDKADIDNLILHFCELYNLDLRKLIEEKKIVNSWTCNRFERLLLRYDKDHSLILNHIYDKDLSNLELDEILSSIAYKTISNWHGQHSLYENLHFAIAGKSSLGIDNSIKMIHSSGLISNKPEEDNLSFNSFLDEIGYRNREKEIDALVNQVDTFFN